MNLAGIMGGKDQLHAQKTQTSVIVECAYFNPEKIIGKTVKYNYKF